MTKRNDKNTKRRLAFEKQNAKREKNMTTYGAESGAAVVVGKTVAFNRRLLAAFLALVFVLTTVVVGLNIAGRAEEVDGFNMFQKEESGLVTRKGLKKTSAKDEKPVTYDLRMEAYATSPLSVKNNQQNTPLDIVLVMDESETMETKDVLTGGYEVATPASEEGFTVAEAETKYINIKDESGKEHFYKVFAERSPNEEDYVIIKDNDGKEIDKWTAQDARNKYLELNQNETSEQNIYCWNGSEYETVYVSKVDWYKHAGNNIAVSDFFNTRGIGMSDWGTDYNSSKIGDFYYNSAKDIATHSPDWHKVHEITQGITLGGYYIYLWYYTKVEDASTVTDESTFNSALKNNGVAFVPGYYTGTESALKNNKKYHAWDNAWNTSRWDGWSLMSSQNYIGGLLYTRNSISESDKTNNSVPYNYMYSESADGIDTEMAWALTSTSKTTLSSSTYSGKLHTAGYKLYYKDDAGNQYEIEDSKAVYGKNEVTYKGMLYDLETIERTDAAKLAANKLAEAIAQQATDNEVEHRIAVVGFNESGVTKTGLQIANQKDGEDENSVNDNVDQAIKDLGYSGGSSIAAGLNQAATVFNSNPIQNDERKRIVVLLTDDTSTNSDAYAKAAVLKDTYNASVYTVGLYNTKPADTTDKFMSELSSEYYATAGAPTNVIKVEDDENQYYYTGLNRDSLIESFAAIAEQTQNSTTVTKLDAANAVLKDIITDNFDVPKNPTITVEVQKSSYNNGTIEWTATSAGLVQAPWDAANNTLTVKNFDYSTNYVDYTDENNPHDGQKVIVTIKGLTLKEKVKTESDKRIYSNTADSGVYKNGTNGEALLMNALPRPFVDKETQMAPKGTSGVYFDGPKAVVNKYIAPNENGKYDLTLEAYTTEANSVTVEKLPTDFVVVVDQSGSMEIDDMPVGYKPVTSTKTLEEIAKKSYYIQAEDGNFYRVYPTRDYLYRYYPANYWYVKDLIARFGTRLGWFMSNTEATTTFKNQMYFREVVNGQTYYQPITMTVKGSLGAYKIQFAFESMRTGKTYEFDRNVTTYVSGNSPWYRNVISGRTMKSGFDWWAANAAVQTMYSDDHSYVYSELGSINTGMFINYPMYDRHVGYTELRYRDANGVEHTLPAQNGKGQSTWEFCNANGEAITTNSGSTRPQYANLYEADGTITRLEALQESLKTFAETVASDKNDDGSPVDNTIAIVGFSSDGFNNNELLTNTTDGFEVKTTNWTNPANSRSSEFSLDKRAHDGIQKSEADANTDYYKKALITAYDTQTGGVDSRITAAIEGITAHGGTQPETGLEMAKNIIELREKKTFSPKANQDKHYDRNTIVIFFTDGHPGDYDYSNMYEEANDVVKEAKNIKNDKTKIFSIGVFGESDGNPLTYVAHAVDEKDASFEYDNGWVDTLDYSNTRAVPYNYYYLNRNYDSGDATHYGTTANDTIYDYMSVVSSNYPNASNYMNVKSRDNGEADISGYSDYLAMVNNVRGDYIGYNEHYRLASSQDGLTAAFAQAITLMNEKISESALLDSSAILRDVLSQNTFVASDTTMIRTATVEGTMDRNNVVHFDPKTTTNVGLNASMQDVNGKTTVNVKGFDYLENYIKYGKEANYHDTGNKEHQGKKLVVTITDVYPDITEGIGPTGNEIFSNDETSAIYVGTSPQAYFPKPAINRHSYTLDVGDANRKATFDVTTGLAVNGVLADPTDEDLADVILVYPNGNRALYSTVGEQTFSDMKDGETFYFENVPSGYVVRTDVAPTDDAYKYYVQFESENKTAMSKEAATSHDYTYDNRVIHITSERTMKQVSIWEQTIGDLSNPEYTFNEIITMEIPKVDGESNNWNEISFDSTFNDAPYTAVFEKVSTAEDGTMTAKLKSLTPVEGFPAVTVTDGKLPMKHNDKLVIKTQTGNTVKVQQEDDPRGYFTQYYSGQDDVAAGTIKLTAADGTPISGTHVVSLIPIDGVKEDAIHVTFENGKLVKYGDDAVTDDTPLKLAPFQAISSEETLEEAVLDVDGTKASFDAETDENDRTQYIAVIKRVSITPPVTVTLDRNNMDILIINEKGMVPDEGIHYADNHNKVFYLLAGAGVLALAAGGYYVWKRKDELTKID